MKVNSEAIYRTKASPLNPLSWGRCTKKQTANGTTLYFTVFDWPEDQKIRIPDIKNEVISATLLATGAKLQANTLNNTLEISLPSKAPDKIASVIKVEFKGTIENQVHDVPKKEMKTGALD
jgi:alpha-L-fucosidase